MMTGFLIGAMSTWVIISVIVLLGEHFDWLYKDWFIWVCAFPVAIIVWIVRKVCRKVKELHRFIVCPFRLLSTPIDKNVFDYVVKIKKLKRFKLSERFYLCWDSQEYFRYLKMFFVQTKKEEDRPKGKDKTLTG